MSLPSCVAQVVSPVHMAHGKTQVGAEHCPDAADVQPTVAWGSEVVQACPHEPQLAESDSDVEHVVSAPHLPQPASQLTPHANPAPAST